MTNFSWEQMGIYVAALVVVNGILFRTTGSFIKKWMEKTEKTVEATASALSSVTLQQAKDLADASTENRKELANATAAIALDIKTDLREHRVDDGKKSDEIKTSIDKLAEHIAAANGRTSKIEGAVREISTRCEERSRAFYREGT